MADNVTKEDYVVSSFKLSAEIEGVGTVTDIVAISGTFALNTIPKASLTMACGINATTGKPATAHRLLANLKMRAKVDVFLEVDTIDGKKENSPPNKVKVFSGYYAGFGFQRAKDNAQYSMHLVHWLDDLNVGSMLTRNFFPGAPFALAEAANCWDVTFEGGGASGAALPYPSLDHRRDFIKIENIEADMWGKVIKPILEKIAGFRSPEQGCDIDPPDAKNTIKEALAKINGGPNAAKLALSLRTLVDQITPSDVANGVDKGLAQTGLAGYHYSTFWSVLVGAWAPNFFFAVSPSVDFANVFPYFGGLRFGGAKFKTIKAEDYSYANFMANTGTILEGVNIYWSTSSNSGFVSGSNTDMASTKMCLPLGLFPPKNKRDHRGTVLVKEPPAWLNIAFDPHTIESTGIGTNVTGDAFTGTADGNDNRADGGPTLPEAQNGLMESKFLDKFAEHWYKHEFLQQRYGEMSGRLRFDIAPGSIVKIESPRKMRPPELADTQTDMIAMVAQVSFVINAELANAGTAFSLTNIRAAAEDRDDLKTADKPPLYSNKWEGGPLSVPS